MHNSYNLTTELNMGGFFKCSLYFQNQNENKKLAQHAQFLQLNNWAQHGCFF